MYPNGREEKHYGYEAWFQCPSAVSHSQLDRWTRRDLDAEILGYPEHVYKVTR